MKIRPTIVSMLLDILLSALFYTYMIYTIVTEEGLVVNLFIFLVPMLVVVGVIGLLAGGDIPSWIDRDPKYFVRYKAYLLANSIMYFLIMGICACFAWYWWAVLFAIKMSVYGKVRIDYTVAMEYAEEILEDQLDEEQKDV